jgi:hypothetical protein
MPLVFITVRLDVFCNRSGSGVYRKFGLTLWVEQRSTEIQLSGLVETFKNCLFSKKYLSSWKLMANLIEIILRSMK